MERYSFYLTAITHVIVVVIFCFFLSGCLQKLMNAFDSTAPGSPAQAKIDVDAMKHAWAERWDKDETGWRVAERITTPPFTRNVFGVIKSLMDLCDDKDLATWIGSLIDAAGQQQTGAEDSQTGVVRQAMAGATVFVPLCGDTPALSYFARTIGCDVVGVDIAEVAIRRAVSEQFADFSAHEETISAASGAKLTRIALQPPEGTPQGSATLYIGDAFALMNDPALLAGRVDFVYDRASIVAIDPSIRHVYVAAMRHVMTRPGATRCRLNAPSGGHSTQRSRVLMSLNLFHRPVGENQSKAGPPFHIPENALFEEFGGANGASIVSVLNSGDFVQGLGAIMDVSYAVLQPLPL